MVRRFFNLFNKRFIAEGAALRPLALTIRLSFSFPLASRSLLLLKQF
jgi:hypothetical protein